MGIYESSHNLLEKGAKSEPKGAKGSPKGAKRCQKWAKREPRGAKREPLGGPRVPKVSQGATKMHQKIDLRKRSRKGSQKGLRIFGILFGSLLGAISMKNTIENSLKNRSRKNMENNAKRLPKWSRNRCQNSSKINAKTGIEKDQENHENSCFSERVKPWFWAQNTILLFKNKLREASCEVNARTGNSSKNHRKRGQNPSQNRCKIDTNFILEKVMQKTQKIIQNWASKGSQKPSKNLSKIYSKKGSEKEGPKPECRVNLLPGKSTLKSTRHIQTSYRRTTRGRQPEGRSYQKKTICHLSVWTDPVDSNFRRKMSPKVYLQRHKSKGKLPREIHFKKSVPSEMLTESVERERARQTTHLLTRPGRLRARSGYIGPRPSRHWCANCAPPWRARLSIFVLFFALISVMHSFAGYFLNILTHCPASILHKICSVVSLICILFSTPRFCTVFYIDLPWISGHYIVIKP